MSCILEDCPLGVVCKVSLSERGVKVCLGFVHFCAHGEFFFFKSKTSLHGFGEERIREPSVREGVGRGYQEGDGKCLLFVWKR